MDSIRRLVARINRWKPRPLDTTNPEGCANLLIEDYKSIFPCVVPIKAWTEGKLLFPEKVFREIIPMSFDPYVTEICFKIREQLMGCPALDTNSNPGIRWGEVGKFTRRIRYSNILNLNSLHQSWPNLFSSMLSDKLDEFSKERQRPDIRELYTFLEFFGSPEVKTEQKGRGKDKYTLIIVSEAPEKSENLKAHYNALYNNVNVPNGIVNFNIANVGIDEPRGR